MECEERRFFLSQDIKTRFDFFRLPYLVILVLVITLFSCYPFKCHIGYSNAGIDVVPDHKDTNATDKELNDIVQESIQGNL